MTDKELEEKIKAMTFWSGKNSMSIEDMAAVQPGLARIMPEIGARTWKLFYAAKHANWPMAKFQYKEIIGLFEMGAFMRPKHEAALNQYLEENWKPLEATIAEVTLTGEFAYGVEFAVSDGNFSAGTLGNLGLPAGGLALSYISAVTDQVRVKLAAGRDKVNVLSNPLLMVRDGVSARISVGNDVPTVGATASDPIESDRQITTVLYRRTGLMLQIRPTINAEGLVVMEIDQSISNTVPGSAGVEGAPTFFDRAVTTEVVARSGQSILLGGLISDTESNNLSSVPWISEVPLLGWLFRSESRKKEKTELVLMITPRIIDTPDEWDVVRGGLEKALEQLQLPSL